VADCQPPAGQQEPDHIAQQPKGPGAEVTSAGELPSAHRLVLEEPKGSVANREADTRPD
jgi:hypothetical protein